MRYLLRLLPLIEQMVEEDNYQMLGLLIVECISSETNFDNEIRQRNLYRLKCLDEAIGEVLLGLPPDRDTKLAEYRKRTNEGIEILERELKAESEGMKNPSV